MKVSVIQGDITEMHVDAIVNAANSSLMGGGGVDGAIHRKGGPVILEECMAIRQRQGGCETGQAVLTHAGNLQARFVIHTVGPLWKGGKNKEEEKLKSCYHKTLMLAEENNLKTIAFPNISTGIYGFPKIKAAEIAIDTVFHFKEKHAAGIAEVIFVCYDDENYTIYKERIL